MSNSDNIRLYLNEDIHAELAKALRRRGFDAITTQEAGQVGTSDEQQLNHAIKEKRAIVSFNRGDFVNLHSKFLREGKSHYGIIVSDQLPIGELLRRMVNLLESLSFNDMHNRLEFLSRWK